MATTSELTPEPRVDCRELFDFLDDLGENPRVQELGPSCFDDMPSPLVTVRRERQEDGRLTLVIRPSEVLVEWAGRFSHEPMRTRRR